MLLALPWSEWGLFATVLACTALVARRAIARFGGDSSRQDSPADDDESEQAETTAARRVGNLEVRLHDFSREVEARLEKRAVQLDTLVAAADREIVRLTDLVKKASPGADARAADGTRPSASKLSAAHEQMICHLHGAGYSVAEIAHIVGQPAEEVDTVLRAA